LEPAALDRPTPLPAIAKSEAKNFYYAFVALPEPRRNAICAIYAFMRQADDMADDESLPREERRRRLDAWLAGWRHACQGGETADPVFVAVRDATERFGFRCTLLDELIAGVALDLEAGDNRRAGHLRHLRRSLSLLLPGGLGRGPGLHPHLRLPGSRAEKLAEETGIAFQLTNILRDVAEDAERNRVYLPLEDLKAHGVSVESLLHRAPGAAHRRRARAAGGDRRPGGEVLPIGAAAAAADRPPKAGPRCGCWSRSITPARAH
jgi:phytoene synthase